LPALEHAQDEHGIYRPHTYNRDIRILCAPYRKAYFNKGDAHALATGQEEVPCGRVNTPFARTQRNGPEPFNLREYIHLRDSGQAVGTEIGGELGDFPFVSYWRADEGMYSRNIDHRVSRFLRGKTAKDEPDVNLLDVKATLAEKAADEERGFKPKKCELCDVLLTSKISEQQHNDGRQHKMAERQENQLEGQRKELEGQRRELKGHTIHDLYKMATETKDIDMEIIDKAYGDNDQEELINVMLAHATTRRPKRHDTHEPVALAGSVLDWEEAADAAAQERRLVGVTKTVESILKHQAVLEDYLIGKGIGKDAAVGYAKPLSLEKITPELLEGILSVPGAREVLQNDLHFSPADIDTLLPARAYETPERRQAHTDSEKLYKDFTKKRPFYNKMNNLELKQECLDRDLTIRGAGHEDLVNKLVEDDMKHYALEISKIAIHAPPPPRPISAQKTVKGLAPVRAALADCYKNAEQIHLLMQWLVDKQVDYHEAIAYIKDGPAAIQEFWGVLARDIIEYREKQKALLDDFPVDSLPRFCTAKLGSCRSEETGEIIEAPDEIIKAIVNFEVRLYQKTVKDVMFDTWLALAEAARDKARAKPQHRRRGKKKKK